MSTFAITTGSENIRRMKSVRTNKRTVVNMVIRTHIRRHGTA